MSCYLKIAKKVLFGTIKRKGVNASNSTNARTIIILIIIAADAFVKLFPTLRAKTTNTGVSLIADVNAGLKYTMAT